jgi:hypothetical protein
MLGVRPDRSVRAWRNACQQKKCDFQKFQYRGQLAAAFGLALLEPRPEPSAASSLPERRYYYSLSLSFDRFKSFSCFSAR